MYDLQSIHEAIQADPQAIQVRAEDLFAAAKANATLDQMISFVLPHLDETLLAEARNRTFLRLLPLSHAYPPKYNP